MTVFADLRDTIYSGDPVARSWFLVKNDYLPLLLALIYLSMCIFGPKIMEMKQPFELRNLMIIFNFSIVVGYSGALFVILYYIRQCPWEHICREAIGETSPLVRGKPQYMVVSACWVIYVLKFIEYGDTLFFILRKKNNQVTFLHVFHHSILPVLFWLCLRVERNAMQMFPAVLNGFVHIIMYSYYGLAAMGPEVRKYLWWKKYLTQIQMIQFVLITLFAVVIVPMLGCSLVISQVMDYIFAPIFLVLFVRFYRTTFKAKAEKKN